MHLPPDCGFGSVRERNLWAAVTVRCAWELHLARVKCAPQVLASVRRHVLLSLPDERDEELLGAVTSAAVQDWLRRVRRGRYPLSQERVVSWGLRSAWRDALTADLDMVGQAVWHLAYADGLSLEEVVERTGIDPVALSASQSALRAMARAVIEQAGGALPADDVELDGVLRRLAQLPAEDCRGAWRALQANRLHLEACPRCVRAVRLVRANVLDARELLLPAGGTVRPQDEATLLALHLHPDGRQHLKSVLESFPDAALKAGDDLVLIDMDKVGNHVAILHGLAEEGAPARDHLRGAMVTGRGVLTKRALLGPLAAESCEAVRSRPWGEVDGVGALPEPLPEPPSPARWWAAAVLVFLLSLLAGREAMQPLPALPTWPVEAAFHRNAETVSVRFDLDDRALALVVVDGPDGVEILHQSRDAADKGRLATGGGDYAISARGRRLLVAASSDALDDVERLVALVELSEDPLPELARKLRALYLDESGRRTGVDVRVQPMVTERFAAVVP